MVLVASIMIAQSGSEKGIVVVTINPKSGTHGTSTYHYPELYNAVL